MQCFRTVARYVSVHLDVSEICNIDPFSQGAGTAVEDGLVLALALSRATIKASLPTCLAAYETIRKPRTVYTQKFGTYMATQMHMVDGPEQQGRDKALASMPPQSAVNWDGKHIDDPPVDRPDLRHPYLRGYNVENHIRRIPYHIDEDEIMLTLRWTFRLGECLIRCSLQMRARHSYFARYPVLC